jgi:hypothetical protein
MLNDHPPAFARSSRAALELRPKLFHDSAYRLGSEVGTRFVPWSLTSKYLVQPEFSRCTREPGGILNPLARTLQIDKARRTGVRVLGVVLLAISTAAAHRDCSGARASVPNEPRTIVIGGSVSSAIGPKDKLCADLNEPCRPFGVTATDDGVLTAKLTWSNADEIFRLELWRGDFADGACCRNGETVKLRMAKGDHADIRVVGLGEHETRQAFRLDTTFDPS